MALQITCPDPYGVAPLEKAYACIVGRMFDDFNRVGTVYINVYRNEAARRAGLACIREVRVPIDAKAYPALVGGMLVSGADLTKDEKSVTAKVDDLQKTGLYGWLKTLPEWKDAKDV